MTMNYQVVLKYLDPPENEPDTAIVRAKFVVGADGLLYFPDRANVHD